MKCMAIPKSEARTKAWLLKHDFYFMRAGRSFGLFDFIALKTDCLWMIQAKCNQGPRRTELTRLKAFNNYPPYGKKWVFIWKAWQREPIIKEVPNAYENK